MGRPRVAIVLALSALSALSACRENADHARRVASPPLGDVRQSGLIDNPALVEASGLARGAANAGVFWSHNDSGNDALLFALDSTGASRGTVRVTGATNTDWEAIASGPCESGSCLYIGDVGDNKARRAEVTLWRVREPLPSDTATAQATQLDFRYPDGPHDVEAMWVAPDTTVWLVTKRPLRTRRGNFRPALLFRLPAAAWRGPSPAVAELVDSLPITPIEQNPNGWITDASYGSSVSGPARVVIRTYQEVFVLAADPMTGRPGGITARCSLSALRERYGEAVTWMQDNRLLFANEGRHSRLWTGRCAPP